MEIGERPWGTYFVLNDENTCKVKKIIVQPNQRLSYQYHNHRSEIWTIVYGKALVIIDEVEHYLEKGDVIKIPQSARHRIQNVGSDELIFIEVQLGTYFGEDDIIRLQDDYQREDDIV